MSEHLGAVGQFRGHSSVGESVDSSSWSATNTAGDESRKVNRDPFKVYLRSWGNGWAKVDFWERKTPDIQMCEDAGI